MEQTVVSQIYCLHVSDWPFEELQRETRPIQMWSRYVQMISP